MKNLIFLAVMGLALVHGYFYLSYGTFDACKAAAFRMVNQQTSRPGEPLARLSQAPLKAVSVPRA
jgi:hypothetical protein